MNTDDAVKFIVEYLQNPPRSSWPTYGYEFYLPSVMAHYVKQETGEEPRSFDDRGIVENSPVFYEAAWELCLKGILRPSLKKCGGQATDDGASGNGYTLTSKGKSWLESQDHNLLLLISNRRFQDLMSQFREQLGEGFFQRALEARACYDGSAYLACCAMVGAATESIFLKLAIEKSGDEESVLDVYKSSSGRRRIENQIIGQAREPLKSSFHSATELIKYWRDEASHGQASIISELEANEALSRLIRFSYLVKDHWADLASK